MKTFFFLTVFALSHVALSTSLFATECISVLSIESDDALYSGHGEVQICIDDKNRLDKMIIIKPVENSDVPNAQSKQFDERNPKLEISLEALNKTTSPIVIMKPRRFKFEIEAATLSLVNEQKVDPDKGGIVMLKVLKSKTFGTSHEIILGLYKVHNNWKAYIKKNNDKDWQEVMGLYFVSGLDGIKKIQSH